MFNLASQDSMNGAKRGRIDREVSCIDWIGHSFYTEIKLAKVSDERKNRVNMMSCRVMHGKKTNCQGPCLLISRSGRHGTLLFKEEEKEGPAAADTEYRSLYVVIFLFRIRWEIRNKDTYTRRKKYVKSVHKQMHTVIVERSLHVSMTSGSRYFLTDLYFSEWYINGRRRSNLAHFSNFFKKSFCHVELLEDPHEA